MKVSGVGNRPFSRLAAFLESALPQLDKEGIELVGIRELVMGPAYDTLVDVNHASEWPIKYGGR